MSRPGLRGWMLAVALAAAALGGERWHRRAMARRGEYQARAVHHLIRRAMYEGEILACRLVIRRPVPLPDPEPLKASYHAAMCRKYEDAAASPWFPAPPDPPEPQ